MSEKLTRIRLPEQRAWSGLMEWGEQPVTKMIAVARARAKRKIKEAKEILKASPEEFQVDVVRGAIVQHHIKELQNSTRNKPTFNEGIQESEQ